MDLFEVPKARFLDNPFAEQASDPPIVARNSFCLDQLPLLESLGWKSEEMLGATVLKPDDISGNEVASIKLLYKLNSGGDIGPHTRVELLGAERSCCVHFRRQIQDGIQLTAPGVNLTRADEFAGGAVFGPARALAAQSGGLSAWQDDNTKIVGIVETSTPDTLGEGEIAELASLSGVEAERLAVVVTPSTGLLGMTMAPLRALSVLHAQLESKGLAGSQVQLNQGDARINWHSSLENGAATHPSLLDEVICNPDLKLRLGLTFSNPPERFMNAAFINEPDLSDALREALVTDVGAADSDYLESSVGELRLPRATLIYTIGNKYFSVQADGEINIS